MPSQLFGSSHVTAHEILLIPTCFYSSGMQEKEEVASTGTNALIENVIGSALGIQVTCAHRHFSFVGRFVFVASCYCTLCLAAHGSGDHPQASLGIASGTMWLEAATEQ